MRFVYQLLYRAATMYQQELRLIDRRRQALEKNLSGDLRDSDLVELHGLESTLVYFATSLRANATVLSRLTRYRRLEQYPDDRELLDDVIVEIQQAIEMTSIYRDDIKGTRELFSSILDNRLNNAMKYLTSITLLMAVPTVVSGLYGMNDSRALRVRQQSGRVRYRTGVDAGDLRCDRLVPAQETHAVKAPSARKSGRGFSFAFSLWYNSKTYGVFSWLE